MSSPTPVQLPAAPRRRPKRALLRDFWQRVSEGRQLDELWSQFAADARATYGFYKRDVDWEEANKRHGFRRGLHILRQFFWSLLLKLAPARRVLLLLALALLMFSNGGEREAHAGGGRNSYVFFGVLILFLLLALELADKVIMKRDLEIAREIQSWLVPSQPPEVLNADIAFATRPQNSVAGDYYDAFYANPESPGGGKLMLVIADVAGKSVPAALLMATFQASLRTIAGDGAPLAALAARLNRYSCAHSLDGLRFTTAVLAEYDPASRHLTYVNAGHNAPILRRTSGATELLEAGGLPLGIDSSAAFETGATELDPGDVLIFFTDGVVEAVNQAGDEYGNQRWLDAIRTLPAGNARTALQYLMKVVDDYVGSTRQTDDITYLIFKSR
ncbi:MAG: PP2C family protein-serine/threonine phosphatase [Candidatus Acidiferrales bacterium]